MGPKLFPDSTTTTYVPPNPQLQLQPGSGSQAPNPLSSFVQDRANDVKNLVEGAGDVLSSEARKLLDDARNAASNAQDALRVEGDVLRLKLQDLVDDAELSLVGEAASILQLAKDYVGKAEDIITAEARELIDLAKEKADEVAGALNVANSLASAFTLGLTELPAKLLEAFTGPVREELEALRRLR